MTKARIFVVMMMMLSRALGRSSKTNSPTHIRDCAFIELQREAAEIT